MSKRPEARLGKIQDADKTQTWGLGRKATAVALAVAGVSGLAAGCGSSGSSRQATKPELSPPATSTPNATGGNSGSTSTTPNTPPSTSSASLVGDLCSIRALTTITAAGLGYPSTANMECVSTPTNDPSLIQWIQIDNVSPNSASNNVTVAVLSDSSGEWDRLVTQGSAENRTSVNGRLAFFSMGTLLTKFDGMDISVTITDDSGGTTSKDEALAKGVMTTVETQGFTAG